MNEAELKRFVREEIKRQVQIVLFGTAGENDQFNETISQNYPGMPDIPNRPVMHPYGISSRAPQGTISVNVRVGEHIGNRMTIGHRDAARPAVGPGEVVLYDQFGHQIYLSSSKIQVGSASSAHPMVLGDILKSALSQVISALASHTHISTAPGAPTMPPDPGTISTLNGVNSSPIGDGAVLSKKVFTE